MRIPPDGRTFRTQGKIISVHPRLIAVNALKDEAGADKILEWLKGGINRAWEGREDIEPSYTGMPRAQVFEILKMLPMTNCKKCGQPTCMVFAAQAAEGGKGAGDCPELSPDQKERLGAYLKKSFPDGRP